MRKKMIYLSVVFALSASILSACGSHAKQADQPADVSSGQQNKSASAANNSSDSSATVSKVEEIKVTAKDFEFDKKEIHVKKGDKVKITLYSADGGHGLAIPEFNVDIQGNGSAEFTADKAGTFEYHCSVMCGAGHSMMTGKLIVE